VAAKDTGRNTLTVSGEEALYAPALTVRDINLIACDSLSPGRRLFVKTRYLQKEQPAFVEQTGSGSVRVIFEKPQRALTPGQAAVFYDGDVVVGGGTICSV
jgi:tRNA-specific 2-thiouridylase